MVRTPISFTPNYNKLIGKCRDCGLLQKVVNVQEWWRSSQPRCIACGSLLDRVAWDVQLPKTPAQLKKEAKKQEKQKAALIKQKINYSKYLQSDHWIATRRMALRHAKRKCTHCGTTENLQVHHLHYGSLGHEKLKDLMVLCQDCHGKEHARLSQIKKQKRKRAKRRRRGGVV